MEAPPSYMPAPPKRKSNAIVWWIIGGVCLCCIGPIVVVGGLGFWGLNKIKGFGACIFAYQNVQTAIVNYAHDHDGKLPNAATWQTDIKDYYRKAMLPKEQMGPFEQMSPDGDWGCKETPDEPMTGMAFNSDLSGKKLDSIKDPYSTVLIFETEHPGKNLHESYKPRPYSTSPKMMGMKQRGWYSMPVMGSLNLENENGRKIPINTATTSGNGFNIDVKK